MRTKIFVSIMFLILGVSVSLAQKSKRASNVVVREGVGLNGLRVGRSTRSDVIRKYGRGFKFLRNGKYSFQMRYANGLSFYYCQSDKVQRVFVIEMRSPFRGKTAKGIVLGKSTLAEVRKLYGKAKVGLRYKGVEFYYARYRGKKIVSVIDIVEKKGMRQCN